MLDKLPADIVALIDTVFTAFNSKNATLLNSVYDANVVIVDGFAPYRWSGAQAVAEWWADAKAWAEAGGVENEHLDHKGILAWGVSGDRAYASISATLTITLRNGKQIIRPGILTYTFARQSDVWRAEGHAWGRLS
jgi:ketosteroid isomerase-like protein